MDLVVCHLEKIETLLDFDSGTNLSKKKNPSFAVAILLVPLILLFKPLIRTLPEKSSS